MQQRDLYDKGEVWGSCKPVIRPEYLIRVGLLLLILVMTIKSFGYCNPFHTISLPSPFHFPLLLSHPIQHLFYMASLNDLIDNKKEGVLIPIGHHQKWTNWYSIWEELASSFLLSPPPLCPKTTTPPLGPSEKKVSKDQKIRRERDGMFIAVE